MCSACSKPRSFAVAQGDFTVEYAYDDHDRVTQVTYPEPGYAVFHEYDTFGYHRRSRSQRAPCSLVEAAVDWEWLEADPSGNVVLERAGNGVQTERRYERGTFRPERITAHGSTDPSTPLQDLVYTWSEAGDLDTRENALTGQLESFDYDGVHRLTDWEYGGSTFSVQYDGQGNITAKGGQSYAYDASTNRLESVGANTYQYDGQGNVLDDGARTLTWTAMDKVRSLQAGGDAWSLLYDADGNRVARHVQLANEATYTFSPSYELRFDGSSLTEARISIMGATGRVVAEVFAERTELAANDTWEQRKKYVHDDHLGSPSVVTDRAGAVESNVMYGPWGQAREGENWFFSMSEAELEELPIGYTGHQPELDGGLINMRGRMYDPVVGRFLSADPVVENALELETWNAYSYVLNRPLSLTDPTGLAAEGVETDWEAFAAMDDAFAGFEGNDAENGFSGYGWHVVTADFGRPPSFESVLDDEDGKALEAMPRLDTPLLEETPTPDISSMSDDAEAENSEPLDFYTSTYKPVVSGFLYQPKDKRFGLPKAFWRWFIGRASETAISILRKKKPKSGTKNGSDVVGRLQRIMDDLTSNSVVEAHANLQLPRWRLSW